jgi:hypothetical protein
MSTNVLPPNNLELGALLSAQRVAIGPKGKVPICRRARRYNSYPVSKFHRSIP